MAPGRAAPVHSAIKGPTIARKPSECRGQGLALFCKTRGPVCAVLEQIRRDRIPDKLLPNYETNPMCLLPATVPKAFGGQGVSAMRIIARRTLREFIASRAGHKDQPALTAAIDAWFDECANPQGRPA
jgi:hypothetical protein